MTTNHGEATFVRLRLARSLRVLCLSAAIAGGLSASIIAPTAAAAPTGGCDGNSSVFRLPGAWARYGVPTTPFLKAPFPSTSTGLVQQGWEVGESPGWLEAQNDSLHPGAVLRVCASQRESPKQVGIQVRGDCYAGPCTMYLKVTINGVRRTTVAIPGSNVDEASWSGYFAEPHVPRGGSSIYIQGSIIWHDGKFWPKTGLTYRSF